MLFIDVRNREPFVFFVLVLVILFLFIMATHLETGCFSDRDEPIMEKLLLHRELFDNVVIIPEYVSIADHIEHG